MNIDLIGFEVVREGLFNVENFLIDRRVVNLESIENIIHISRIRDSTIKVCGEPGDALLFAELTDL